MADLILAPALNVKLYEKQELLDIIDPKERLEKIYSFMEAELGMLRVEKEDKEPGQKADGKEPERLLSY